jgi:curved DNA-binding protein CbpA
MVLKPEVIEAFNTLGIKVNAEEAAASRAYKKLALLHHPDRNRGDKTATKRFQQVAAAPPSVPFVGI